MTTVVQTPAFAEGIQYFGEMLPGFETHGKTPVIAAGQTGITDASSITCSSAGWCEDCITSPHKQ